MKTKILKNKNFAEDQVKVNGICTDFHKANRDYY